jgi:hypothetical protein
VPKFTSAQRLKNLADNTITTRQAEELKDHLETILSELENIVEAIDEWLGAEDREDRAAAKDTATEAASNLIFELRQGGFVVPDDAAAED